MRTIRPLVAAAILAAGTVLAACGGDDEATADTLTAAEFIEQANALCTTESQAIGEVIGPLFSGGAPSPEDQQAALDKVVALSRGLATDIGALAEPSSLTADVDALVHNLDSGTDEAAEQTGADFFGSDDDPWAEATVLAKDLGLDACGPED